MGGYTLHCWLSRHVVQEARGNSSSTKDVPNLLFAIWFLASCLWVLASCRLRPRETYLVRWDRSQQFQTTREGGAGKRPSLGKQKSGNQGFGAGAQAEGGLAAAPRSKGFSSNAISREGWELLPLMFGRLVLVLDEIFLYCIVAGGRRYWCCELKTVSLFSRSPVFGNWFAGSPETRRGPTSKTRPTRKAVGVKQAL